MIDLSRVREDRPAYEATGGVGRYGSGYGEPDRPAPWGGGREYRGDGDYWPSGGERGPYPSARRMTAPEGGGGYRGETGGYRERDRYSGEPSRAGTPNRDYADSRPGTPGP